MVPPLVICPLEIERSAAARWSRRRAEVARCGPGPRAIRAFLDASVPLGSSRDRLIILFGVAGGLTRCARCPPITRVIDGTGREWRPSVLLGTSRTAATLLGVDLPVGDPAAKREWSVRAGATIADTESHVFAAWATQHGGRWAIIRGVSDGPDESLPDEVSNWVDEHGRSRAGRVARDLLTNPSLIRAAWRLARQSTAALSAAGATLDRLLTSEAACAENPA